MSRNVTKPNERGYNARTGAAVQSGNVVREPPRAPTANVVSRMTVTSLEKSHVRARKWTSAKKMPRHTVLFIVMAPYTWKREGGTETHQKSTLVVDIDS